MRQHLIDIKKIIETLPDPLVWSSLSPYFKLMVYEEIKRRNINKYQCILENNDEELLKQYKELNLLKIRDEVLNHSKTSYSLRILQRVICDKCFSRFKIEELVNFHKGEIKQRHETKHSAYFAEKERNREYWNRVNRSNVLELKADKVLYPTVLLTTIDELYYEDIFLCSKLREMKYADFLRHWYWLAVREYLLKKRGRKCELCSNEGIFNVHHKSYQHRGCEHLYLEDLIILCSRCHKIHHGKNN